jgi:hypothetical protein
MKGFVAVYIKNAKSATKKDWGKGSWENDRNACKEKKCVYMSVCVCYSLTCMDVNRF